jgi:WD40 repeat protein
MLGPDHLRCTGSYPVDMSWGYETPVCAVAIRESATQLALATVQSLQDTQVKLRFPDRRPHTKDLCGIAFVPHTHDRRLVTVGDDRNVVLWNLNDKVTKAEVLHSKHSGAVMCVCPSIDGAAVYTGGADKRVL